jgi:GNAT superfamily N-acetyltransferase
MLRPTVPEDTPVLLALTEQTGVFKRHEVETLAEVLADYHAGHHEHGQRALTWDDGGPTGFVYFGPTPMTDRTWDLWWIVVGKARQGKGLGGILLDHVEQTVRHEGGRLLLIETSSLPHYEPTRRFYLKRGYAVAARIADFYADGDDKVIFSKRIAAPTA